MASNPVFRNFDKDLSRGQYAGFGSGQGAYPYPGAPAQPMGYGVPSAAPAQARMTMGDVMNKSLVLFGIVLAFAAVSWQLTQTSADAGTGLGGMLWLGGMVVTLVLGFIIAMKKKISVPLIITYAVAEGVFLGAVSAFFESMYPGVVTSAVMATLCVFAGVLLGYRAGIIRVTARSARIFMFLLIGYGLFALVNFGLVATGVLEGFGVGGAGPLGLAISAFAILLASYSLAVDFDSISDGVSAGVPQKTSWLMAYGLMVSVVWLYVELLRLFSRLRQN